MDLSKYSTESLNKISNVLKVVLVQLELRSRKPITGIVLTPKQLGKEGLYKEEFLAILRDLNSKGLNYFNIYNDLPNFSSMGLGDNVLFKLRGDIFVNPIKDFYTKLENYLKRPVIFSPNQQVLYKNGVLFFKLGDDTPEAIDFSNALGIRNVFECFWELHIRNPETSQFNHSQVSNIYKELYGGEVNRHYISRNIGDIRRTKIKPKPHLVDRFKIDFDKKIQKWNFLLK